MSKKSKQSSQSTGSKADHDSAFRDVFDAFIHSFVFLVMAIIYNILAGAIAFLGYFLATRDGVNLVTIVSDFLTDPVSVTELEIHYGLYIMVIAFIMFLINTFAAFLFTASRNTIIARPLGYVQAYLSTWRILFQMALVGVIFGGAYFGLSYLDNDLVSLIFGIICLVVAAIVPLAMMLRTVDFLLELEQKQV